MMRDVIFIKKKLFISKSFLLQKLDGLTDEYLRKAKSKSETAWRSEKVGKEFYYDLETIPDRAPANYRSRLPDIETLKEMAKDGKATIDTVLEAVVDKAIKEDYYRYMPTYSEYPKQQKSLAISAAVLEAIANYFVSEKIPKREQLGVFVKFSRVLDARRDTLVFMPRNERRLQDKVNFMLSGGAKSDESDQNNSSLNSFDITKVVYPAQVGNQQAKKIEDKEVVAWIFLLRGSQMNFTNAFIVRKVQLLCRKYDKTVPSDSWIEKVLGDWETKVLTAHGRWDSGRHLQRFANYVPHARPLYAGECWQMDGTRYNLTSWLEKNEKTGKWVEKHLYMVVVRDVYSGYVLGWSFGLNEDRWMYANALYMAYQTAGHLPNELVSDKFPGHNTDEWKATKEKLEKHGVRLTTTTEATGKASIERWIGTLQTVFQQESLFAYGEGIRSTRSYAHRHPKYLERLKKEGKKNGWDAAKAVQEGEKILEAYNTTPLSDYSRKYKFIEQSPEKLYQTSEKPNVKLVNKQYACLAFCDTTKIQIRGDMIHPTIDGVEYHFQLEGDFWRRHPSVLAAFDRQNLDEVYLFDVDNKKYLGIATNFEAVQRYGSDTNMGQLGKRKARIAENKTLINAAFADKTSVLQGLNEEQLLMIGKQNKDISIEAESRYLSENIDYKVVDTDKKEGIDDLEDNEIDPVFLARAQY